jgi:hypothetical protein
MGMARTHVHTSWYWSVAECDTATLHILQINSSIENYIDPRYDYVKELVASCRES